MNVLSFKIKKKSQQVVSLEFSGLMITSFVCFKVVLFSPDEREAPLLWSHHHQMQNKNKKKTMTVSCI